MTTERPTAASYREMAANADVDAEAQFSRAERAAAEDHDLAPHYVAWGNGESLRAYAHALRCAAEDAEKMQKAEVMLVSIFERLSRLTERIEAVDSVPEGLKIELRALLGGTR